MPHFKRAEQTKSGVIFVTHARSILVYRKRGGNVVHVVLPFTADEQKSVGPDLLDPLIRRTNGDNSLHFFRITNNGVVMYGHLIMCVCSSWIFEHFFRTLNAHLQTHTDLSSDIHTTNNDRRTIWSSTRRACRKWWIVMKLFTAGAPDDSIGSASHTEIGGQTDGPTCTTHVYTFINRHL